MAKYPLATVLQAVERLYSTKKTKQERKKNMSYKKPEIVASSEATQPYVAGCPTNNLQHSSCSFLNKKCLCGPLN